MLRTNGRCHVYFQDKVIESTGNPKSSAPPPPFPAKGSVEIQLDHFWPWLNNIDQGGARRGALLLSWTKNLKNFAKNALFLSAFLQGKKVKNS